MAKYSAAFRKLVKSATGRDPAEAPAATLAAHMEQVENDVGMPFECVSLFPAAGRAGSVHRDCVLTRAEAKRQYASAVQYFTKGAKGGKR